MLDYPEYSCDAKMLDCHLTCCMQSYCAPHKGLCLNFKFCQTLDEENDCQTGGMTLCEAITYALTCGKAFESKNVFNMDNYEFNDIIIESD